MKDQSKSIAARVANEILPHEALVRNWLKRRWGNTLDIDDLIQESYSRIASLDSIDHIDNLRSYFFRTAHAVATDLMRRAKVENFSRVTEIEWSNVLDESPSPDRVVDASQRLERVNDLLSKLTWTCRRVIELRRIEGLSQRDTALRLGVSESVVENHIARGLKSVLDAAADRHESTERKVDAVGKSQFRKRNFRR
ncbi:hypothetical protein GCM10011487_20800 [Steroidobacter agaridevorans]|uniref:RNA polymerase subunit sigma-24 n=1 Tax=Steroidobacter agaridevorans TaxID=2695856 RepID=A0A829YA76_9GAMM|nr:sigma-70 family RNA polymerase sigma factor [Steroidobacter agaridevorans]GFE80080.1 hypothetical protein GCM10011487_20800 [Steroidobacter agaridevorans]